MTRDQPIQVVVAAGGLGTRAGAWSRYLPKEWQPVDGRPGIVHVLEEIAHLGPAHVVVVHHPYYSAFAAWARQALSPHGQARYLRAASQPLTRHHDPIDALTVDFIAQHGPYGNLTSLLNAADHFAASTPTHHTPDQTYLAFADNLYPGRNPLLALRAAPTTAVAVLARPYRTDLAAQRGVIITTPDGTRMAGLVEKPDPTTARRLEQHHGPDTLWLVEGRARLNRGFLDFARSHTDPPGTEPNVPAMISAYSRAHPVMVVPVGDAVIDLGSPEAAQDTHLQTA